MRNDFYHSSIPAPGQPNVYNRSAVFRTLAGAGVTSLALDFDLTRAAAQVRDLRLLAGDRSVAFPAAMVRVFPAKSVPPASRPGEVTLLQAIEGLLRDALDRLPGEPPGTRGTFRIDVAEQYLHLTLGANAEAPALATFCCSPL